MPSIPLRFLALGDSYTIGESVQPDQRWPNKLASRLVGEGIYVSDPEIIARTGWTTRELLNALNERRLSGTFELVSLLIGVNNQYRGLKVGEYRHEFRILLQYALNYAGGDPNRVMVLSIPDWGKTPFAQDRDRVKISVEIAAFNRVNRAEAELAGAHHINIDNVPHHLQTDRSLVAADGLHPSVVLYDAWVKVIFPIACEILQVSD